jgi:16S rRNA A1518/A1519 N6-dimethyltransferase RsmA/KsgA/DIM1 with predicted DNA glycosylase/AP lyase activity
MTRILDVGPGKGAMLDVFAKYCNTVDLVEFYPEYYNQLV